MSVSAEIPHPFTARTEAAPAHRDLAESARSLLASGGQALAVVAAGLLLPAALFTLWWIAADRRSMPEQILPAPQLVWQSIVELWQDGTLTTNLEISAARVGWSLAIGGSIGFLLGLGMGLSKTLRAYLFPTFDVISQFPVLGWIPILIIFVGIDEPLKISAISLAVVVPVAVNTLHGIANVPRSLFEVASVYRLRLPQVIFRVVLPAAGPSLFTALRQGVMQAWLTLVFVELLASSEGIGYLMVWGRQLMQMDLVVVGMVVIGAVGVAIELVLRAVELRLNRWRPSAY